MARWRSGLAALAAVLLTTAAGAQPAARDLAATCAACHSAPAGMPAAPSALAGMAAPALRSALAAFAAGEREATVMAQIAKGLTPAQMDALAAWFAAQPR